MFKNSETSSQSYFTTKNIILKSLPEDVRRRLLPDLTAVELKQGQSLYRAEEKINYVYFPDNAIVSVVAMTTGGESVEINSIGNEGLIGMEALLGTNSIPYEMIVRNSGEALRISVAAVKKEFMKSEILHDRFLKFVRLAFIQTGQTALCNRFHTVKERFAKWLLLCCDRIEAKPLNFTHELLALRLGTNRPTITVEAINLQKAGHIKYVRGFISIINREGLEKLSCQCYQTIKQEHSLFQKQLTPLAATVRGQNSERYNRIYGEPS